MSWSTFGGIMLPAMQSLTFGQNSAAFAKSFTVAYDTSIKLGGKTLVTSIPLIYGNSIVMESTLVGILQTTSLSKTTTLLDIIGPAILSYWTGAQLMMIPPAIPAPGTIGNISVVSAPILNPGIWTPIPVPPNNNPSTFINAFINSAKLHLTTVSGIHFMVSQYPPPAPPAPSLLPWSGYIVMD